MILLWFFLGIALIFAVARYNESNKLFWTLLFAFVMGFAGTKMVLSTISGNEEESSVNQTQVISTQMPTETLSTVQYYITDVVCKANGAVTGQYFVSQSMPVSSEKDVILSEISRRTRDQPQSSLIKPPELCLPKDFLTLPDTG